MTKSSLLRSDSDRKWTAGSWNYTPIHSLKGTAHTVMANDGNFMVSESYDGTDEEDKANAHLIAAAPDLYEALDAVLELENNTSPFGGEFQQDRIERTFKAAHAALAKARGEAE